MSADKNSSASLRGVANKLTEERIKELWREHDYPDDYYKVLAFARAIEAELQPDPVIARLLTEWKTGKKDGTEVCCALLRYFPSNPSNEQPDFCDKNCTWRDHHPDCERAELQPGQEPASFYIYKETAPRLNLSNVTIDALPWVYDQDPSSGFSARMKVYLAPPDQTAEIERLKVVLKGYRADQKDNIATACEEAGRANLAERRIATLKAALREAKEALVEVSDLIGETQGVYGLHMNGDPSPWEELEEGGRFERLGAMPSALATINKALGEE